MKTLNILALMACLAAPAAAQSTTSTATTTSAAAADVIGTWDATVTTTQGQAIPTQIKLKKDGEKIVGSIAGQAGETPVQADVTGKTLTIRFTYQGQGGQPMGIELAGMVDGDTIKGTMAVAGEPGGQFVAARMKESKDPSIPSLTGTWNISVELPNITATPTVVLKQDGEKLTGDYVSAQYGKFPITGTLKGSDVSFWFAMNVEGNALNVTYTGTVDKDGSLKGTVAYGDMMSGTFVASKKR